MADIKFSILHISDLHKDSDDSYENLYSSLESDFNQIKEDGISLPNIITVSGDIISGGNNEEIIVQYKASKNFLEKLVTLFLKGDKRKIVIVPGNHDIDWNMSKSSMKKIEPTNISELVKRYHKADKGIRWSWDDLNFYEISDEETYKNRIKHFTDFYNSFYGSISNYSPEPNEQCNIFDLPEFGIAVIGFNSCYDVDHLNFSGCINPLCLSKLSQELNRLHNEGRILIGLWHHNSSGLPNDNNYLDWICRPN
jgi:predicted MPP superfamily phosphohydrolase